MPIALSYYAEALMGLGNFDEAFYSAGQALVLAEEDKAPESIGMAWRTLGMISEKRGKPASLWHRGQKMPIDHDPDDCYSRSAEIFAEAEIEIERARTLREWARYKFSKGNAEHGVELWETSRTTFEKLGAVKEVERMNEGPA